MNFLNILLQASTTSGQGQNAALQQILLIVVILVIFYFFMIRPQMKRSKEQKKFRDSLQKGQRVVTIGGIHGKIVDIQETTVSIEVEDGSRLRMEKSAIALRMSNGTGQFIRDYMFPKSRENTVAVISEQLGAYREIRERVEDLEKRIGMLDAVHADMV